MVRRAVVIGAGPAGIVGALYLAQMDYDVVVYERRPEPSVAERKSQHSYPMLLASRATVSFAELAISPACCSTAAGGTPCLGHYAAGRLRSRGDPLAGGPEMLTWVVDRVGLAADLLAEARRAYSGRVRFVFCAPLLEVDLAARRAVFGVGADKDGAGEKQVVESGYDLLVGADGANSAVRAAMVAQVPGFQTRTLYTSAVQYKTFHGLPAHGSDWELVPGVAQHRPRQHLYWYDNRQGPMVILWLTEAGQLDGMVSKVADWSPSALAARLEAVHGVTLPAPLRAAIVAALAPSAGAPGSALGRVLRCSALHGPGVALVGDAGHPVTGHMGQGCNMAIESARALASCLRRCGGDPGAALPAFSARRLPDVAAMQHLEICMAAFVMPPVLKQMKAASAPAAAAAAAAGAAALAGGPPAGAAALCSQAPSPSPAPPSSFSLPMRAYASTLVMSTLLWGLLLHKLMPRRYPLPMYLFAVLRDARTPYSAVLRSCRAMAAGSLAVGAAAAAGAGMLLMRGWSGW